MQRLKEQLTDGGKWAREQAKNNPLGLLVIFAFTVWFIVTLWITDRANRWGFDGKTFWEWMDLLIVPLVLALGAFWLNSSQKRTEMVVAKDKQRQDTLLDYFDKMTELLLKELGDGIDKEEDKPERNRAMLARSIAKARTLAVLRSLDPGRVSEVIRFLSETGLEEIVPLVQGNLEGVDWYGANLSSARLQGIHLQGANLQGANLWGANLQGARLQGVNLSQAFLGQSNLEGAMMPEANLQGAYLRGANLRRALLYESDLSKADLYRVNLSQALLQRANLEASYLGDADLSGADLRRTSLSGANLSGANLNEADLSEADLSAAKNWTPEQLQQAKSLENAIMPDGSKYEEWIEKHQQPQPE